MSTQPAIPGFDILQPIGRGGAGTVYLAQEQGGARRHVALKVVHDAATPPGEVPAVLAPEAALIGRVRHPSLLRVYRHGRSDDWHFLVAEYLPGGDLKRRLRAGLSVEASLTILRQLAGALGVAHEAGFVHRDLKPENVLFRANGTPVIIDFGLAAEEGTASPDMSGTPMYMSPEQITGAPVDRRSDVYALGCILCEMLTGRPPYPLDSPAAVYYAHVNQPIPMLPSALADLQPLLERMLAKDPQRRVPAGPALDALIERHWLVAPEAGDLFLATTQRVPAVVASGDGDTAAAPGGASAGGGDEAWLDDFERELVAGVDDAASPGGDDDAVGDAEVRARFDRARALLEYGRIEQARELLTDIAVYGRAFEASIARELLERIAH
jgi:serine/threonine protein kinase